MRFSLRLNNDTPADLLVELAAAAEELGFDQLWVSHDLFLRSAPVLLATVAASTSRISLGTGILNPHSAHPVEIAMAAATLQEVSGGRFLLGLGAGATEFLAWAGIERPAPLASTRRAITELRALLGGRPAPGRPSEGHLRFTAPSPPIYLGAMGPRMLELAGELCDGALPLLFPPEHFPVAAGQVATGLARAGRDPAGFDLAACVWCSIDPDGERAERALAGKIAYYGSSFSPYLMERAGIARQEFGPIQAAMNAGEVGRAVSLVTPAMLKLGIAGDAAALTSRCQTLVDQGAHHLSFGPPLGPDPLAAVRLLGTEVLPALRT